VLDLDRFLPAPGQGAIAITARSADARALRALQPISDAETAAALAAERAFLAELEGSCRTPIAGLARFEAGRLRLRGEVLRADGSECFGISVEGAPADAERLGRVAGRDLAARLPEGVLARRG
jgi:hydroxymethylbilane synthase